MFISSAVSRVAIRGVGLRLASAAATSSSFAPKAASAARTPPTVWLATRGISSEFQARLLKEKDEYAMDRSHQIQPARAEEILEQIRKTCELESRDEAMAAIALMFQQGGTARSADGNMAVSIFGKRIKLAEIRQCLKYASSQRGERKLAKSFATEIQEIACILEVPGNMYKKIQKRDLHRQFTMEEKSWLSDFQADNENCPAELRQLIVDSFKKSGQ